MHDLDVSEKYGVYFSDAEAIVCVWQTGEDRLPIVSLLTPLKKYTRRAILSQLSKSFDSLGIFSPFFVRARLLLQRMGIKNMIGTMKCLSLLFGSGRQNSVARLFVGYFSG